MPDPAHLIAFARQNIILVGIMTLSLLAAIWFTAGIVLDVIYFNDPQKQDVALQGWMTPRYVGMSYDLPRSVILELFEVEPGEGRRKRLADIAAEMGVSLPELTERVRAAADAHREQAE